eukprot:m.1617 g.1617  ORF g.1617 m.1617 type:complete len:67 (+) comp7441_c0_seq1:78-278(+)
MWHGRNASAMLSRRVRTFLVARDGTTSDETRTIQLRAWLRGGRPLLLVRLCDVCTATAVAMTSQII